MITIDLDAYEEWLLSLSGPERLGYALLSMVVVAAVIFFVSAAVAIVVATVEMIRESKEESEDEV
jgi:ammonia channel protein AmtB